jgi:predicted membrane protein
MNLDPSFKELKHSGLLVSLACATGDIQRQSFEFAQAFLLALPALFWAFCFGLIFGIGA